MPAVKEALEILVKSYDKLGMTQLHDDAQRVLETSYPAANETTAQRRKSAPWWKFW